MCDPEPWIFIETLDLESQETMAIIGPSVWAMILQHPFLVNNLIVLQGSEWLDQLIFIGICRGKLTEGRMICQNRDSRNQYPLQIRVLYPFHSPARLYH